MRVPSVMEDRKNLILPICDRENVTSAPENFVGEKLRMPRVFVVPTKLNEPWSMSAWSNETTPPSMRDPSRTIPAPLDILHLRINRLPENLADRKLISPLEISASVKSTVPQSN